MDFDVLIQDPDGGTPRILAWGAPGTGPNLKEYSNRTSASVNDTLKRGLEDTQRAKDTQTPTVDEGTGDTGDTTVF